MGKFTAYLLPLKSLSIGTHSFNYHLDKQLFTDMENTDIRDADLLVDISVKYDGDIYALNFHIQGNLTLICDRCLDELIYPIDSTYDVSVKYGDDYNDDSDEVLEIPLSDPGLNVAYMIYDTVALSIPIKHVHPQGKCNRAMSAILKKHRAHDANEDFEIDDDLLDDFDVSDNETTNSDPRWNALKKLSINDNNE